LPPCSSPRYLSSILTPPPPTPLSPLSLHDALPIWVHTPRRRWRSEYASDVRLPCQADQLAHHGGGEASGRQDEFKLQNVRPGIMPRQAADGEAKNTPLMLHSSFCEPLGDCRFGRHGFGFQRLYFTACG